MSDLRYYSWLKKHKELKKVKQSLKILDVEVLGDGSSRKALQVNQVRLFNQSVDGYKTPKASPVDFSNELRLGTARGKTIKADSKPPSKKKER